jgi:hypothetical protein
MNANPNPRRNDKSNALITSIAGGNFILKKGCNDGFEVPLNALSADPSAGIIDGREK